MDGSEYDSWILWNERLSYKSQFWQDGHIYDLKNQVKAW